MTVHIIKTNKNGMYHFHEIHFCKIERPTDKAIFNDIAERYMNILVSCGFEKKYYDMNHGDKYENHNFMVRCFFYPDEYELWINVPEKITLN